MSDAPAAKIEVKEHDVVYADEETTAQVELPKVAVKSGTESLECIFKMRVKLYRFRQEQWKERGIGNCKLMRDKTTKRIRFLMRQEKTLKPVANFFGKLHLEPVIICFSERNLQFDCDVWV